MVVRFVALALALAACKGAGSTSDHAQPSGAAPGSASASANAASGSANGSPAASAAPAAAAPVADASAASAKARALQLITAQIAAIKRRSDAELASTFDKDAVVLARSGHEVDEAELARTLGQIGPHERVLDIKLSQLVVGGGDDAVWLMAELSIRKQNDEPQQASATVTEVIRATELIAASAGWKVVAAAFSEPRKPGRLSATFPMLATTPAGPLTALLASPDRIAQALAADASVAVVPPDQAVAVGPAPVRALLGTFAGRALAVDGATREVRTARWGFAQGNLAWAEPGGHPYRLTAQLIALAKPDGSWSVVALQLLAL